MSIAFDYLDLNRQTSILFAVDPQLSHARPHPLTVSSNTTGAKTIVSPMKYIDFIFAFVI